MSIFWQKLSSAWTQQSNGHHRRDLDGGVCPLSDKSYRCRDGSLVRVGVKQLTGMAELFRGIDGELLCEDLVRLLSQIGQQVFALVV